MGVTVCLPLFGSAGQELEEGAPVRGEQLRELAAGLGERLLGAAEVLDRLGAAGWSGRVALYDVILTCPGVETRAEAEKRLLELGANPEQFMIVEDVEDEEDLG
jgi:hypothetical protein